MNNPVIQVTIIYESEGERCNPACGIDWSSTEAAAPITQRISERFGEQVELEYIDLSQPGNTPRFPELKQLVEDKNIPLPVLVIGGQPIISGQFDARLLLDAIDAEIEIRQDKGQV